MDRSVHDLAIQEGQQAVLIPRGTMSPEERVSLRLSQFYICECAGYIVIRPPAEPIDATE